MRISVAVFLMFWLGAQGQGNAAIDAVVDPECFRDAVGPVTVVDFEDLPPDSSSCPVRPEVDPLPDPLVLAGVRFIAAGCLNSGFCSSPTCAPDPRNPQGGNIVLSLDPGSRIELPPGTTGILLEIQGMGSNSFTLRAVDLEGETAEAVSRGVLFGVAHLGFVAAAGLSRLEIVATGGTGGPVAVSALLVGSGGGAPACGRPDERLHFLDPAESLTLRFLPELGILEKAPDSAQSMYFKTTSENREFRRGFIAFDVPDFHGNIETATLFLEEEGATSSRQFPPDLHEISFFEANRGLDESDFDEPASPLATIETRFHVPGETFSIDVARVLERFRGTRLWFRIKLAVDPDFADFGSLGTAFRGRIELRTGEAARFTRGDADGDGKTDLTDAVTILEFLFLRGSGVTCLESANVDDDDRIDLTDPIALLQHLFSGGPPPRAPFPDCGDDPESLSCRSFAACP